MGTQAEKNETRIRESADSRVFPRIYPQVPMSYPYSCYALIRLYGYPYHGTRNRSVLVSRPGWYGTVTGRKHPFSTVPSTAVYGRHTGQQAQIFVVCLFLLGISES